MARLRELPEDSRDAGALDGTLHPRENFSLVGQNDAETQILDAYRSGRMHHAWLLTGMEGIGKATLAFRTARFILANPDPEQISAAVDLTVRPDHPAAVKIAHGTHPNLLHIQRDWDSDKKKFKATLGVDSIRRIIPFLGTTAGEGAWRFIIIDPADDMTRNAANALLKALEEPPNRTLFFLTSAAPGRLLPTIRSRCRTLHCNSLSEDNLLQIVRQSADGFEGRDDRDVVLRLAGGSARKAIRFARGDGHQLYRRLIEALDSPNTGNILAVAEYVATSGLSGLSDFMEALTDYFGRRVRGVDEPLPSHTPRKLELATWAELWEKAARSDRDAQTYNLDVRHIVTAILETYASAAQRHI